MSVTSLLNLRTIPAVSPMACTSCGFLHACKHSSRKFLPGKDLRLVRNDEGNAPGARAPPDANDLKGLHRGAATGRPTTGRGARAIAVKPLQGKGLRCCC